jgi:two-component system sensor histidine kinase/response regulator
MNGFVSKPINPEELWRALLNWTKPRAGLGQAPVASLVLAVSDTQPHLLLDALRRVEGLDADRGLSLSNRNSALYVSMLAKFVKSQEQAAAQIQEALRQADGATAERLAHTLKGLAASMGAEPLRQVVSDLESALHNGADTVELERLMPQVQQCLHALMSGLRATPGLLIDAAPATQRELTPAQHAEIQAVIQKLQQMLEQDDSEAQSLWEDHASGLRAVLRQPDALEEAINGFDFEEALRLLQPQV